MHAIQMRIFDFECLRRPHIPLSASLNGASSMNIFEMNSSSDGYDSSIPLKRAANVFWFGDLNFRVHAPEGEPDLLNIGNKLDDRLFRRNMDYEPIIQRDELILERSKGLLFEDFKEGLIKFPPTHKLVIGTNEYAQNRIPSYTDRVLYWSRAPDDLVPLRYDSVWEINVSDHKPVYCTFRMRVLASRAREKKHSTIVNGHM